MVLFVLTVPSSTSSNSIFLPRTVQELSQSMWSSEIDPIPNSSRKHMTQALPKKASIFLATSIGLKLGLDPSWTNQRQWQPLWDFCWDSWQRDISSTGFVNAVLLETGSCCSHFAPCWGDPGWEYGQHRGSRIQTWRNSSYVRIWEPRTGHIWNKPFSYLSLLLQLFCYGS